jgi:hypothetical protein
LGALAVAPLAAAALAATGNLRSTFLSILVYSR